MDQYPFEFNITIIGQEVDNFIDTLRSMGYEHQADEVLEQFGKQLREM